MMTRFTLVALLALPASLSGSPWDKVPAKWNLADVSRILQEIILEQKVATTPEAMKQTFERIPRSLIALETGTHSPWVSRLLRELGHQVLVAHAQKVQLITKSSRKGDRHDARTLARLARIDPEL